jgi:hypothetical protein
VPRAVVILRVVVCAAAFVGLGALASVQPATAAVRHQTSKVSTSAFTPSPAPLPTSLPDRGTSRSGVLNGTSCSSTSFCVAVGYVLSDRGSTFPLVETYTGGAWTPSVTPLPQGYATQGHVNSTTNGWLASVSCPTDGTCAAVGGYQDPGAYQQGLLETLSGGRWTATEAARPTGTDPERGLVNIRSVSCSGSTTCVAAGDLAYGTSYFALVYMLTSGVWQLQPQPPLPPNYQTGAVLASVSCPGASDCVVVGSYQDASFSSHGLILTLASGTWSVQETPLPANANPEPDAAGLQVLGAVDCPAPGTCVAGGGYVDTAGNGQALLVSLQGGTWSASEAPVPSGAQNDQWAIITGMSCAAVGACVAVGSDLNSAGSQVTTLVFTQSSTGWSVASVMVTPASSSMGVSDHTASGKTGLRGVSCASTSFCRAVGSHGRHPLIEKMRRVSRH